MCAASRQARTRTCTTPLALSASTVPDPTAPLPKKTRTAGEMLGDYLSMEKCPRVKKAAEKASEKAAVTAAARNRSCPIDIAEHIGDRCISYQRIGVGTQRVSIGARRSFGD